jgi:Putative zinc-finger
VERSAREKVDCTNYIEKYLSAHVDGELSAAELRDAEEHLAGCVNCRVRFAEERAVKALLRERAAMLRTPPIVRGSILAALDAIDSADASKAAAGARDRSAGAGRAGWFTMRRARIWVPAALAAMAVFAFVILHGGSGTTPAQAIPPFDVAIDNYKQFVDHFEPNIKSNAPADISDAYMEHELPGFVWNFQRVGYKLVGGRVDRLPDGTPVAYTFYRGDTGTILCTYMKSHGLQVPPRGELRQPDEPSGYGGGEHHYYQYKGYRVCLSYPRSGCICILVTVQPMPEFIQDIIDSQP